MVCTAHRLLFGWSTHEEWDGQGMWNGKGWAGLIWLRIWTGVGLLWMRYWTFGLHKMRAIWLAEYLLASLLHGVSALDEVLHSPKLSVFQIITERSSSTVHCCASHFLSAHRTICTLTLHYKATLFSPLKILDSKTDLSSPSRIEVKHEGSSTL